MDRDIDKIREESEKILVRDDVKYVIGYEKGTYGFRVSPLFVEKKEDLDRLVLSPLCTHNLINYVMLEEKEKSPLPRGAKPEKKKIALFAKGCDTRAIVQLIAEKGIARDDIIILGIPCSGIADIRKLERMFPSVSKGDVAEKGDEFMVTCDGEEHEVPKDDLLVEKCKSCRYPNPLIYDVLIGEEMESKEEDYKRVKELESKGIEERWAYWEDEFSRCIRCYACRDICPLCYCDNCILERLSPQWIRRSVNLSENTAFHIARTIHLAGRCVGCGECERACPMNIPISELNKKMEKDVKELFDFTPGIDTEQDQLLTSFRPNDPEEFIL
jgi:ferredoxin